jgi:RNA polymerase sigma-70 factor (ECF subfamily)
MERTHSTSTNTTSVEIVNIDRDELLVSAAQAGVASAFAELRDMYSRRLYRTVFAITKNKEDAEDALQDSFLRAYIGLKNFQGRANFYSWLTRIAINSSLMILRKKRTHRETSYQTSQDMNDDIVPMDVRDTAPDPERCYEQNQRQAMLMKAIGKLKPTLREVVEVRMAEECSVKEAAVILDISEAAAKSRLYRARLRLSASTTVKAAARHRSIEPRKTSYGRMRSFDSVLN